jgi:uncharacterized phage protein gp47/JayE
MTKTVEDIYEEMRSQYCTLTGITVHENCDMAVRLYAAAAQIYSLYVYGEWVRKQSFPQTATGSDLDCHAQMRGIARREALYATGYLRFGINTPVETDIAVPVGTVCMSISGAEFETTAPGTIPAGKLSCDVPARAVIPGESGNAAAKTIILMTAAPVGVAVCNNPIAFSGGTDTESDESLRARILASYSALPNGANAAFYEKVVLDMEEVAAVRVLPKKRGLGTVDIIITGVDGLPSDTLLLHVLQRLNEMREICVDIDVQKPTPISVNVSLAINTMDNANFPDVESAVRTALQGYFDGTLLGQNITLAKLGNLIYSVPGVRNYSITSPTEDIQVGDTELAVLGNVTVRGWN